MSCPEIKAFCCPLHPVSMTIAVGGPVLFLVCVRA
jgi:hypothetical protein